MHVVNSPHPTAGVHTSHRSPDHPSSQLYRVREGEGGRRDKEGERGREGEGNRGEKREREGGRREGERGREGEGNREDDRGKEGRRE